VRGIPGATFELHQYNGRRDKDGKLHWPTGKLPIAVDRYQPNLRSLYRLRGVCYVSHLSHNIISRKGEIRTKNYYASKQSVLHCRTISTRHAQCVANAVGWVLGVTFELHQSNGRRYRDKKYLGLQISALHYRPISTKIVLFVAHLRRVLGVKFEFHQSNERRVWEGKLYRPPKKSALRCRPISTKFSQLIENERWLLAQTFELDKSVTRWGRNEKLLRSSCIRPFSYPAAKQGKTGKKNCFGLKSKMPFSIDRFRPNSHCLYGRRRDSCDWCFNHRAAVRGETGTKNCFGD
jgi:hypothetical protein